MQLHQEQSEDAVILRPQGEVDLASSPALRIALQELLQARCPLLLLDMSGVAYIDSSGLAALIEYGRDSSAQGGKMALFGLTPRVKTVFELVRLNELFPIASTMEEARNLVAA